jgi:transcriptional regulator GlxA family with amidase domain
MTIQLKTVFLSAALAALVLPAAAQSTSDTTSQPAAQKPATIKQRKENQQDRIGNGIQSGQLTAGEAGKLEKKEATLNQEERDMRKLDNGHLTAADKATLNQQQNKLSKNIYKQKHDAQVQNTNPKSEVGQRQRNQQERIAQGVKSGQLTAGEAGHLEGREAAINKEVHTERAANGGKLTPAERTQVNHQENRTSRAIYRKKHNARQQ